MARVKAEERQKMEADGVWELFKRRRDHYKALGDTPAVAKRKALAEYYHPDAAPRGCRADAGRGDDSGQNALDESEFMPKAMALEGADTSMLKSVKWVASVLGTDCVQPENAPGPQAWALYLTYRARSMWAKFWERFGSAMLPTKANFENKDRFTDDGREIDPAFLRRIEQARDAAILQTSTQGVNP